MRPPQPSAPAPDGAHPPGAVRLGHELLSGRPCDIPLPSGVVQHATLLGLTGAGKTTTAERLAEGAIASGLAVLVIDAKGAGLRSGMRRLAESAGVAHREMVPGQPGTLGYNPCATGTRAQVADKLVSAFTHGPDAQIYRVIAAEAISVLTGVLRALDEKLDVRRLRRELDRTRMPGLAHRARDIAPDLAADLAEIARRGGVSVDALEGMRARLGALLHGEYGAILDAAEAPQLDLVAALTAPGISYVSLPALAVSEDTALMARVLIQDLKQAAYERLRRPDPAPALLILDEFAALGDPEQVQDLLRQAREARIGTVVSTQQLPDARRAAGLRHSLLGAGLLVAHRLGADDADAVARVIGSVRGARVTRSYEHGEEVGRRTVTAVDRYAVEPDALQRLATGEAVVLSATGAERRLARIAVLRPEAAS
jgi:hypothetical protein